MDTLGKQYNIDAALMPVTTFRILMTMSEKSAVKAAAPLKPKTILSRLGKI